MEQKIKTSPKDFFLYLSVVVSLYISTISIIALWFKIIDEFFADPLRYSDPYSAGISLAIASLFVIFPLFLFISWVLHKNEVQHPEKRELGIRKWLIYLTLFIAGLVIVIDLITLINTFLSGREFILSFVAKVFIILVVIGTIFIYYVQKVRVGGGITKSLAKKLTWSTALFVIVSIAIGFVVMGSPGVQRMKRIDQERVSDLSNIQWQIVSYWQKKEILPLTLDDLKDSISGYRIPTDPKTGKLYKYKVTGELTFELCTTFNFSSEGAYSNSERLPVSLKPIYGETWEYKKGETCFDRKIDPELYPSRTPKIIF